MLKVKVNESYELFRSEQELINFIGESLGEDIQDFVQCAFDDRTASISKLDTDLLAYEGQIEECASLLGELDDCVSELLHNIESKQKPRISMIVEQLKAIQKKIVNGY